MFEHLKMIRVGCILLLTLLILQAGGLLVIDKIQQIFHQHEMQLVLDDNNTEFQRITLSYSDYHKYKLSNNELSINGDMYDIKSVSMVNNQVILLAVHDHTEEEIIEKINKLLNNTNTRKSQLPDQLQQLLSLNYLVESITQIFLSPLSFNCIFYFDDPDLVSNDKVILSPPPQFC